MEQSAEQVGTALVADAEAATTEKPGERALDHPAVRPQPLAGLHAPTRILDTEDAQLRSSVDMLGQRIVVPLKRFVS
jgi:hypothetical protein